MAVKLLGTGLALLAGGLALLAFTDLDPTTLFLGGGVVTFLGVINLVSVSSGLGAGANESDTSDAMDLVRANYRDRGYGIGDRP